MKYQCNFQDLNGEGVKVAIIDSGVDRSHEMLQPVTAGICFEFSEGNVLTSQDYRDTSGHGTAVASIIKKKAPGTDLFLPFIGVVALACPSVSICVHLRMCFTFYPHTTCERSGIFEATERLEGRVSSPLAYSPIAI